MFLLRCILGLLFPMLPIIGESSPEATLTFLQFNDVYEISPVEGRGGFAQLMTALKEERAKAEHSITVVSGDFLSPSVLSNVTKGKQMIEMFNAVGVNVVTLGNHEFDFGTTILKQRMDESNFVWLGTNVFDQNNNVIGKVTAPFYIKEIAGIKVGFIGILTPKTTKLSLGGKLLKITSPVEAARKAVKELQNQGAEVIVALTHLDIDKDLNLAKEVPEINLILGGHDHIAITYYKKGVLIHKSGTDTQYLGVIKLTVIKDGKNLKIIPSWCMRSIFELEEDPSIAKIVENYTVMLDKALNVIVGKTLINLDSRVETVRGKESSMGNLIADALKNSFHAEVAFINGGSIRGHTLHLAGSDITRGHILSELPFDDEAVVIELKGKNLLGAIENGLSALPQLDGRFPQVSGLKIYYDPDAPEGNRVLKVEVNGQALNPEKKYRVATSNYLFQGGDNYNMFANGKLIENGLFDTPINLIVLDYLGKKGAIDAKPGRLIVEKVENTLREKD